MSTTKKDITSALMRGADSLRDTIDACELQGLCSSNYVC